jgi:hypothetical protein
MPHGFPLPIGDLRVYKRSSGPGAEQPYLVGAMVTADYAGKADRLAASCDRLQLAYAIYRVPTVHRSISHRGSADAAFTKANFIHFLLGEHRRPILYVDADCVFAARPELIDTLVAAGTDFAIYNWLADEHTDAFVPVPVNTAGGAARKRFFRFSHSIDYIDPGQLICSGAVQLYGDTERARALLARWQQSVAAFAQSSDDECLDFTFNNLGPEAQGLRVRWLPKAYARYCWWIYEQPVIDHPDMPNAQNRFQPIADPGGRLRFYPERAQLRAAPPRLPRDCIVDTELRLICRPVGKELQPVARTELDFWL